MPIYFDATFSWSGYSYQGKVGMFIVLKYLNAYQGNNLETHFTDWSLEFEWLEDFSIKNGNTYLSLHQVKTLNSTNITSYAAAIQQVEINAQNALEYQITPYFHVSSNVANPHNIFYTYTINGINQRYCPLEQIDGLIKDEISFFLQTYNQPDYQGNSQEVHFLKLLSIIDEHVRQRHSNIQNIPVAARQIETISFNEIIDSLKTNSMQFTNGRMIYEKKKYFANIVDDICQDLSLESKTKINNFSRNILNLDDDKFVKFSKSIFPHSKSSNDREYSIRSFQELLNRDHMIDVFWRIIQEIDKEGTLYEHKFHYDKENKKYLPTAIQSSDASRIANSIMKNPFAIEDLYEMDFFITERIDCDSIEKEANNFNEIRDEDLQNTDNKENNITELKQVALISINKAKGKIDA